MKRSSKVAQRVAGTERPEPGIVDYTGIIRQYGQDISKSVAYSEYRFHSLIF